MRGTISFELVVSYAVLNRVVDTNHIKIHIIWYRSKGTRLIERRKQYPPPARHGTGLSNKQIDIVPAAVAVAAGGARSKSASNETVKSIGSYMAIANLVSIINSPLGDTSPLPSRRPCKGENVYVEKYCP